MPGKCPVSNHRQRPGMAHLNRSEMRLSLTGWVILLNVAGAIAYLMVGSQLWWIEPELADIPGASGGSAVIWFVVSVYFVVGFGIVNLVALLRHVFVRYKKRGQKMSIFALLVPAIWILAIWIDYRHHGM